MELQQVRKHNLVWELGQVLEQGTVSTPLVQASEDEDASFFCPAGQGKQQADVGP